MTWSYLRNFPVLSEKRGVPTYVCRGALKLPATLHDLIALAAVHGDARADFPLTSVIGIGIRSVETRIEINVWAESGTRIGIRLDRDKVRNQKRARDQNRQWTNRHREGTAIRIGKRIAIEIKI
ncbi:hypothetical protein EVAR_31906_1 [Eumeta japonica]|uniref:Uncharacterized protein n=1 Tax=Eumeta variegata TaxID=151549 RepID=A0A4C1XQD4_EUMVA|nr:hypothetical protein EVAR_31906_1 [Eumeta japonica]